jgi:hypothetical protein
VGDPVVPRLHEEIALMPNARPTEPLITPPRRRSPAAVAAAALLAVSAALLIAGCGGGAKSPGTGTAAGTSAQAIKDPVQAAFRFSACMRQHGVTSFPDPVVHSSPGQQSIGIHVPSGAQSSPTFKTAQKACQSILPAPSNADTAAQAQQQRAHTAGMLSFARCVRQHGITGFPDPNPQGNLSPQILSQAGIDVHASSVLTAARACISASHGQVTAQAIQQASSGSS